MQTSALRRPTLRTIASTNGAVSLLAAGGVDLATVNQQTIVTTNTRPAVPAGFWG